MVGSHNSDTGLTGRKIIVDTYGGRTYHGCVAFSVKDSSKVDRSAAIIKGLELKNPIYLPIASYAHFGRSPYTQNNIEFFAWEKFDAVEALKAKLILAY